MKSVDLFKLKKLCDTCSFPFIALIEYFANEYYKPIDFRSSIFLIHRVRMNENLKITDSISNSRFYKLIHDHLYFKKRSYTPLLKIRSIDLLYLHNIEDIKKEYEKKRDLTIPL